MSVAYDLIVLGRGATAANLAVRALAVGARVAQVFDPNLPDIEAIWSHVRLWQSLLQVHGTEETRPSWNSHPFTPEENSLTILGLDVIPEPWRWERPQLIRTESRCLAARHVIVVDESPPKRRSPLGRATCPVLTPTDLFQSPTLPESLIIVGGDALSCAIAQVVGALGVAVTLVADPLLPNLDRQVARLVTHHLSDSGIRVYAPCRISALESATEDGSLQTAWLTNGRAPQITAAATLVPELPQNLELPINHARHWLCRAPWEVPMLLHRTLGVPLSGRSPHRSPLYYPMTPPVLQVGTMGRSSKVKTAQLTTATDFYKIAFTPRGQFLGMAVLGHGAIAALPLLDVPFTLGDLSMGSSPLAELARKAKPPRERRGWLTFCRDWNLP